MTTMTTHIPDPPVSWYGGLADPIDHAAEWAALDDAERATARREGITAAQWRARKSAAALADAIWPGSRVEYCGPPVVGVYVDSPGVRRFIAVDVLEPWTGAAKALRREARIVAARLAAALEATR